MSTQPHDPYLEHGLTEAKEIWHDAIFPERVEAEKRVAAFSRETPVELSRLLIEATDDERIRDNHVYIAASLALLRKLGIDELSL